MHLNIYVYIMIGKNSKYALIWLQDLC